jgi:hypothetical protein
MKKVLIPTDFNVESTKIIDALAINHEIKDITIIFLHAFKLSDSISDMLMLSRRSKDYENISDEFYEKINFYSKKYHQKIKGIGIEYFYGSTVAAFKNFLDHFGIDTIIYPQHYHFQAVNKLSIDPKYLTDRCGRNVLELDIDLIADSELLFETKMHEEVPANILSA